MSLVIISLQTTVMVMLLRYSRTNHVNHSTQDQHLQQKSGNHDNDDYRDNSIDSSSTYVISIAVFIAEMMKLMLSLSILHMQNGK